MYIIDHNHFLRIFLEIWVPNRIPSFNTMILSRSQKVNLFLFFLCPSYAGSNSLSKEVNQNRIVPTSLEQELSISCDNNQSALRSSKDGTAEVPVLDLDDIMNSTTNHMSSKANDMDESGPNRAKKMRQQRKHRYCCFSMN